MLLEGEEGNLGALHRAIQWRVGNFLLSIVTHISTCSASNDTLRAMRPAIGKASAHAVKQARPKAALACNTYTLEVFSIL